jgi:hypothetical protein
MHFLTRSYLTAGLSAVAAGAIIATPVSTPAPQQEPSNPLLRNQQVQLAALATPITVQNPADKPKAVHVLAEVSRAFQAAKAANVASAVGATSASPSVARTKVDQPAAAIPSQASAAQTGAVTTQDPATADTPGSDGGQSSTVRGPVVNAFDPSGVGEVLADTAQLAIDTFIEVPAFFAGDVAFDVDDLLHDVVAGDPDAFSNFFQTVSDDFQFQVGRITDDFQSLQDSIGNLFGVDDGDDDDTAAAVTAAKTATKPGTADTDPASGAVDKTTAKQHQGKGVGTGSKGDVTGTQSQDVSAKPAKAKTPEQKGETAPADQSSSETKDPSNSKTTESTSDTKSQAGKEDTRKATGQSTSNSTTSSTNEHKNAVSSSVNDATKATGTTKTNSPTNAASRKPSHAANAGAKHPGASGASGGKGGKGGKSGKGGGHGK